MKTLRRRISEYGRSFSLGCLVLPAIACVANANPQQNEGDLEYFEAQALVSLIDRVQSARDDGFNLVWSDEELLVGANTERFHFVWVGTDVESPSQAAVGAFAVDRKTGDVCDASLVRIVQEEALAEAQAVFRRTRHLKDALPLSQRPRLIRNAKGWVCDDPKPPVP